MRARHFVVAFAPLAAVTVLAATTIDAPAKADAGGIAARSYVQSNLVSDIPGLAAHTDANLKNPWGTSVGPGSPIWVSDNAAGVTTLYDGAGNARPLVVTIPAAPSGGAAAVGTPTGQAFNTFDPGSPDFVISKAGASGPGFFLFATEDGTIAGWNPNVDPTHAVTAVDRSTATDSAGDVGAVYKGLALVNTTAGKFLYASNFRFGTIDVFDSHFDLVSSFTDPTVPAGFAPFGIHNIGGKLFVTFAKQDAQKHDDVSRPGNGFVDVFSPNGDLLQRFVGRDKLDSPWAVTLAPPTFGAFGATSWSATSATGESTPTTRPPESTSVSSAAPWAARSPSTGCGDCASRPPHRAPVRTRCSSRPASTTKQTGCSARSRRTRRTDNVVQAWGADAPHAC